MNGSEVLTRKRTLQQMMKVAQREKLEIMSPLDNPKIPKKMSEFDFRNTILDFPMTISPDDLALLVEFYKEGKYINYEKFIDDLLNSITPPSPAVKATNPNPKYVALARHLYERNTDLISQIEFMDRTKIGTITAENFSRALPDFPQAKDVARIAMDLKTREIDYRKLQALLDTIEVTAPKVPAKPVTQNLPQCFPEFVHHLKRRRIQIDEFFLRENRTRTGKLPKDKFFSLIYQLNLPISKESIEEITNFFCDKEGNVNYEAFVATACVKEVDTYVPPPPVIDIEKNVQKIINYFNERRLNIWSIFKPHDRSGTGKVPKTLFLKTLVGFNFDMEKEELRLAVEALSDPETKTVDYIEFAKKVCHDREMDFEETIDSALQKLRDFLMNKKLMLHKYLGLYDRDKSGLISTNQFLAALRKMGYEINDHDLKLFKEQYEDRQTKHYIQWKILCTDVDLTYGDQNTASSSVSSNLSLSPSMRELLTSSSKQLQLYKTTEMSAGNPRDSRPIPDHLIPLYSKIDKAMIEFGFDLEGELISCDKFKKGTVTRVAFKQILDLLPMTIPPEQLDELIKFYTDESTMKIYYLSFTKDIEEFGNQDSYEESERRLKASGTSEEISPEQQTIQKAKTWADEVPIEHNVTFNTRMSQSIDGLPDAVKPLLSKILEYTHIHQSTPEDLFHDFDKLHNGSIRKAAMQRAFGTTGIHYTPIEFNLLSDTFQCEDKDDFVNYLRICNAVKALDKKENLIGMIPLSNPEEEQVWQVVNRIQSTIRNKRKTLRSLFANEKEAFISSKTLFNILENIGGLTLSPSDRKLLTRKYHVNANGDIDWKTLCDDSEKTIRLI